jgi:hypothetical protein
LRAYLDWRNFIGISKESNSYVLLTSHGVWNGGMKFSFPMERLAFLHEMEEIKHHSKLLEIFLTCEWRDKQALVH